MLARIRAPKDFWTGVVYLIVGLLGILIGRDYSFGTASRMGPGYFPFAISCLLVLFGLVSIVRSMRVSGEPVEPFAWKPIVLVIGGVFAFGDAKFAGSTGSRMTLPKTTQTRPNGRRYSGTYA